MCKMILSEQFLHHLPSDEKLTLATLADHQVCQFPLFCHSPEHRPCNTQFLVKFSFNTNMLIGYMVTSLF